MTEPGANPSGDGPRGPFARPAMWVAVLVLTALAFLLPFAALRVLRPAPALPVLSVVPPFQLTDQEGRPFDRARLEGHVTIASFIFTSCPTVCPLLTEKLAGLQERTRGQDLRLASFSVDPDTDTPAVLKAYGAAHKADFSRWTFLTGPKDDLDRAVVDGFKIALVRERKDAGAGPDIWDIVHGEHFVLLDAAARIRGYYRTDEEGLAKLLADAALLVAEPRPPVARTP